MRALSFLQPWVYTIFELGKDVENRKWACYDWMIGETFLIHVSTGFDQEGYEWLIDEGYEIPGPKEFAVGNPIPLCRSAIVGKTSITSTAPFHDNGSLFDIASSKWAFGPHVWQLGETARFEYGLHNVKGALGFWQVDPYIVRQVWDQEVIVIQRASA